MNPADSKEIFPRKLTELEREWLNAALPENRTGYKIYRDKIDELSVLGYGRFGKGNYILGKPGSVIDLSISSAPIFAVAEILYDKLEVYVSINEELDELIEFDRYIYKSKFASKKYLLNKKKYYLSVNEIERHIQGDL